MVLGLAIAAGQGMQPILSEDTVKVSDHVYAIMGFPNVGIVVGSRATLVVDTGLGARNGETITRAAKKLAKGPILYLTTTHFHPEHAGGDGGFPPETILIRAAAQQDELEKHGEQMMTMFRGFSKQNADLLAGATFRTPDVIFDRDAKLDLGGGVTARLLWFGAAHTVGDELIFVDPDRTLISGDVVQKNLVPNILGEGTTSTSWLAVLDQIEPLHARYVLPDHGALGEGSLVGQERALLMEVRSRALALKGQGVSVDEAGKQILSEMKTKHPDLENPNAAINLVKRIYSEK